MEHGVHPVDIEPYLGCLNYSGQVYYPFVYALIDNKDVYVKKPRDCSEPGKVLNLNKSSYRLKQSPVNFYNHIKEKL